METQKLGPGVRDRLDAERAVEEEDDDGGLTAAGWPRERYEGWPVPWLSPRKELAKTDEARLQAAATGAVCAVCGLGYQRDEKAFVLTKPPGDIDLELGDIITAKEGAEETGVIVAMDNGVLHRRCARLALAWCPKLKELLAAGDLVCLEVVAHAATPKFLDAADPPRGSDVLTATFDEGVVVEIPVGQ